MLDRLGIAVMEERRHDRHLAALKDYLRMEYGSTSGMGRYIAEANHPPSPRFGLRAFLAKIVGVTSKSSTRAAPAAPVPAAPVEPALSEARVDHATLRPQAAMAPQVRPVGYSKGSKVRPHTALPPLKR